MRFSSFALWVVAVFCLAGFTTSKSEESNVSKARPLAYKDFLTLWKDADRDILILNQAKAEYAKLQ
ncbi:MAG: hypothetical protein WB799_20860 [Candidatus Sulfotelmatobacter sp.]